MKEHVSLNVKVLGLVPLTSHW